MKPVRLTLLTVLLLGAMALSLFAALPASAQDPGYTLTIAGGDNQSALTGTAFAVPLQVTVVDELGKPASGAVVTFTAPASGASATLATSPATFALANTLAGATVLLESSPNPSSAGQEVAFTASVSGAAGTPTGTVAFYENLPAGLSQSAETEASPESANVVPLTDGVAVFTTSALAAGTHSIVAVYSGDETYNGSTSNAVAQVVRPTSIVVTNADDSGAGSLRQAIADVAAGGAITFADDTTIFLGSTLTLDRNVTIDGGTHTVVVSGNGVVRVFAVNAGVTATLQHLTVNKGHASGVFGGGISNAGNLTVSDCIVSDGYAGSGAGIYNQSGATLAVRDSSLSNNGATHVCCDVVGGAAILNAGTATVTNSIVSASTGRGGIANFGNLTVTGSTFSGNSTAPILNSATATVTNSTFSGNSASGIDNCGNLTVTGSTISGNITDFDGGGIRNEGTATITNCTISRQHHRRRRRWHPQPRHHDDHELHHLRQHRKFRRRRLQQLTHTTMTVRNSIIAGNTGGNCGGSVHSSIRQHQQPRGRWHLRRLPLLHQPVRHPARRTGQLRRQHADRPAPARQLCHWQGPHRLLPGRRPARQRLAWAPAMPACSSRRASRSAASPAPRRARSSARPSRPRSA